MVKSPPESNTERFERLEKAAAAAVPVRSMLQDVYDYVAPARVRFENPKNQGDILTTQIWDSTALKGVQDWATNVQTILMPPFQRWFKLEPGDIVNKSRVVSPKEKDELTKELESITESLFKALTQSNIYQVLNEAFQDLAVSTGVVAINEQPNAPTPFTFTAIPIDQIFFEEGDKGHLTNFWRRYYIKARLIPLRWPAASLPAELERKVKSSPDEEVEIVEGSIKYDDSYFYYVQDASSKTDIWTEWRDYSPFLGFRITKRPGDTYGYSVSQELFPTIKVTNLMKKYILKSAKFKALPAFLATSSGALNPNTAIIEPGSIIPVDPDFFQNPPIAPLETGGDPNFADMTLRGLQQEISEAYLSEPLGDVQETQDRSATEMQLRQQNWMRQNSTKIGRLANELIRPLLNSCLTILAKHGLIKDVSQSFGGEKIGVDEEFVWINYQSPLIGIQDQQDAQNLMQYFQGMTEMFGQNAIMIMNLQEIPEYIAQKMNVPTKFVKNPDEVQAVLDQIAEMAKQKSLQQETLQKLAEQKPLAQQSAEQQPQMPEGEL